MNACDTTSETSGLAALFDRFQNEIAYDAHGLIVCYYRSAAEKELRACSEDNQTLIAAIGRHLRKTRLLETTPFPEGVRERVKKAWNMMIENLWVSNPFPLLDIEPFDKADRWINMACALALYRDLKNLGAHQSEKN